MEVTTGPGMFECDICKTRTKRREGTEGYEVPICSDECRDRQLVRSKELDDAALLPL